MITEGTHNNLRYPNILTPLQSKKAPVWRFYVAGKHKIYLDVYVFAVYFSPVFNKSEFSRQIFMKVPPPVSNFTEVPPVGTALIHANGRTDITWLTVALGGHANTPKNTYDPFLLNSPLFLII